MLQDASPFVLLLLKTLYASLQINSVRMKQAISLEVSTDKFGESSMLGLSVSIIIGKFSLNPLGAWPGLGTQPC